MVRARGSNGIAPQAGGQFGGRRERKILRLILASCKRSSALSPKGRTTFRKEVDPFSPAGKDRHLCLTRFE
jgi:hypothetical protein